jgi:hypothetical protein
VQEVTRTVTISVATRVSSNGKMTKKINLFSSSRNVVGIGLLLQKNFLIRLISNAETITRTINISWDLTNIYQTNLNEILIKK